VLEDDEQDDEGYEDVSQIEDVQEDLDMEDESSQPGLTLDDIVSSSTRGPSCCRGTVGKPI